MRALDMIMEPDPAGSPARSIEPEVPVCAVAGPLITTTCNQIAVTYPVGWKSSGCATPEHPLFILPENGPAHRQLVVTAVPVTPQGARPESLLAGLNQFVLEWAGLERDLPQTGTCALGHYATRIFRLPRSGRVLWFQRWHCTDGHRLVVASHASSGVPSAAAIAEMAQIVMNLASAQAAPPGEPAQTRRWPWWRRWV